MIILQCTLMEPSASIYNYNKYILNISVLEEKLKKVKIKYSTAFHEFLCLLLELKETKRNDGIFLIDKLG